VADHYSAQFLTRDSVSDYETVEYASKSYSTYIWQLQRPVLQGIVEGVRIERPMARLLDFACGTGRILTLLEHVVHQSDGFDVSPEMALVARAKCSRSRIIVGRGLRATELWAADYDIAVSMRFLLNADHESRVAALLDLRDRLAERNGYLVVNVHGHARSARHAALVYRRIRRGERHQELRDKETRQLLAKCGFNVLEVVGFGVVPPTLYRTPLRRLAERVDKACSGPGFLRYIAVDLLYVCQVHVSN